VGQQYSSGNTSIITSSRASGNISGDSIVGGLIGYQYSEESGDNRIADSHATGDVKGSNIHIGGLVGSQHSKKGGVNAITKSYATGNIIANTAVSVGGLVGLQDSEENGKSSITDSYATGKVDGNGWIGGLAGQQYSYGLGSISTITGSYATSNVSGDSRIGGFVGWQFSDNRGDNRIINSYSMGNVNSNNIHAGGFVGEQTGTNGGTSSIANNYAKGNIIGNTSIGGFVGLQYAVGSNSSVSITNCYATGKVDGNNWVGGFAGQQCSNQSSTATISRSYSTGNVSGNDRIGGLVGMQYFYYDAIGGTNTIANSYAIGNVSGVTNVSGLVGFQEIGNGSINNITSSYRYQLVAVNGTVIPENDPNSEPNKKHGGVMTAANLSTKATYTGNSWLFNDTAPTGPWFWDSRGFPKLNMGTENYPFPWGQVITPIITINIQPAANTTVTAGSISGNLSVSASVTQGATLAYQWYSNTTASNTGGTQISGATSASFAIPKGLTVGTYYYYCVISASGAAPVTSNVARVTVEEEDVIGCNAANYGYLVFVLFGLVPIILRKK
jgi:hypothetical protein